jgi:ADP-ribose pyrophosphatase YjhB (NUDIX family)
VGAALVTLNPALEDVRFCPRCGAEANVSYPHSIRCPSCGYGAYYNPKPVAVAIPRAPDGRLWLMRRGFQPQRGRWSMPGGFVDLGESVEDAARREAREELNLDIELSHLVGVYSRAEDRVVIIVYAATAQETPEVTEEALEVKAFAQADIPWDELAFWSDELALREYLDGRS